jgi:tricarboxylate carrier
MGKKLAGLTGSVCAGIATVSTVATVVRNREAPPKFSMAEERWNQDTFFGRYSKFLTRCDPALLVASSEQIREAQKIVNEHVDGQGKFSDRELWDMRQLVESAVHPQTDEILPRPARMTGYVPYNGPICVAQVVSTTTQTQLFWNWVNQSQNAVVNYCNRNASSPMSTELMVGSYMGAVTSALGVVYVANMIIQKLAMPSLMKFVAFPASMVASSGNCFIVRRPELGTGIPVMDADGNRVGGEGLSKAAANIAVFQTVQSRMVLQCPTYLVPAVLMSLPGLNALSPMATLCASTYAVIVSFGCGLPATLSIWPAIGTIEAKDCEPEFQNLVGADGKPLTTLYFNKGL